MKIPELEKIRTARKSGPEYRWSNDENDTLYRYFHKVGSKILLKFLPGRTPIAMRAHVNELKRRGLWNDRLLLPEEK